MQKKNVKNPSVLLDEPENKVHQLSKEGRKFRDILGKIRQLNMFVGVCANSLSDIPSFMYHRLSAICFLSDNHRFWLWDNMKDKPKHTIIDDIKKGYVQKGHAIFKDPAIVKRAYIKNQKWSTDPCFDEGNYIAEKEEDLLNEMESFIKNPKDVKTKKPKTEEVVSLIMQNNPNLTDGQLADAIGISRQHFNTLKNKLSRVKQNTILEQNNNKNASASSPTQVIPHE